MVSALMASGIFAVFFNSAISGPDSVQYDRLGLNLARGNGFSLSAEPPFTPTMLREPGYPVFLALVYMIFGHNVPAALLMQMALHSLTAVLTYYIARGIFAETAAFYSGLVTAIFPTLANMASCVLSETLFTFLLCLAIWAYLKVINKKSIVWSIIAGVIFGILALTKTAAIFLPAAFMTAAALMILFKKMDAKRIFTCSTVLLITFTILISGWALRNKSVFDTTSLTLRPGEALWSRAQKLDDPRYVVMATACYNFSEYLGSRLFPGVAEKPERYLFKDFDKAVKIRAEYISQGISDQQIDNIFRREAIAGISKKPIKYAAYTLIEAIKMTAFTYLPVLNEPAVRDHFIARQGGARTLSAIKGVIRITAYPILILFFAAVWRYSYKWDKWILLFTAVVYFNLVYSLLDAIGRYAVPLIPLYCIMAVAVIFPPEVNEDRLRRHLNG